MSSFSILITAGPTREKIDPVRFISNYSTGTFGYEIAREAVRRRMRVTLVSGPVALEAPQGARVIRVESASQMRSAVMREAKKADCVIMAAAVCDWRPERVSAAKIKKSGRKLNLKLAQNPDILAELGANKKAILVGFALETENLDKNAAKKLKEKNLDIIVANRLNRKANIFGRNSLDILLMDRAGGRLSFRNKGKNELAKIILDKALNFAI